MNDPLLRISNVYSRLSDPQDRYQARIAFGITGDQLVTEMQRQDPTFNLVQLSEIQRLDPSFSFRELYERVLARSNLRGTLAEQVYNVPGSDVVAFFYRNNELLIEDHSMFPIGAQPPYPTVIEDIAFVLTGSRRIDEPRHHAIDDPNGALQDFVFQLNVIRNYLPDLISLSRDNSPGRA